MALSEIALIAGSVSTFIFVGSYLPMLVKAARTKDLSSYSALNLVLANVGNVVYSIYVFSLSAGPLWVLHGFYLLGSAFMLILWARYGRPVGSWPDQSADEGPASGGIWPGSTSAGHGERQDQSDEEHSRVLGPRASAQQLDRHEGHPNERCYPG